MRRFSMYCTTARYTNFRWGSRTRAGKKTIKKTGLCAGLLYLKQGLLEGYFGTGSFKLFLEFLGFFFLGTFFDNLRSAVNDGFGIFQTFTGDLTNNLDNRDLLTAGFGEFNVETVLLFFRGSGGTGHGTHHHGRSSRNTKLIFENFDELSQVEHAHLFNLSNQRFELLRHF